MQTEIVKTNLQLNTHVMLHDSKKIQFKISKTIKPNPAAAITRGLVAARIGRLRTKCENDQPNLPLGKTQK